MKLSLFIEKYFWVFFIAGLLMGLIIPVYNDNLMSLLKPLLMVMLFLVFLKTDVAQIFTKIRNYKQMTFLSLSFMLVIPLLLFFVINLFDQTLAIGVLLLTAMPAAVASPALTDIVKGNIALSTSIVIITSLIAPLTVPFLFWLIQFEGLSVNPLWLFKDLAIVIIIPVIASQLIKKYAHNIIVKNDHVITSVNVIILSFMVYIAMASQREVILSDFTGILWHTFLLYIVSILLHFIGYFMGFKEDNKGKIAITIASAYKNNGMAIVLAALYFEPAILILMVLSELPWNTLLIPYRKFIQYQQREE
ncbi:MAG: bile acid:sodium symporter [Dysgonamonadaceae bacterium]|nr:bile acid:sodium symporter [Dysgonamonadaceae bacterium]MDD4728529.1 bile acid:sodium symporter [Dysgonamonadaceae bacterium]